MKKINNVEELQEILRDIITTQDPEEIKNFNTLYDYSNITDMSFLWENIFQKITKKIDWENIKFPTLDMKNVEMRRHLFNSSPLYKINLINTHNIKDFSGGFVYTENLEKISLDLNSCIERGSMFYESGIREVKLKNTGNIKYRDNIFSCTKDLEKISLDLSGCERRENMFGESGIREVELLNTQNIKSLTHCFFKTNNLEKLNDLYLDNCEEMNNCFEESNIKKVELYNTGKVKYWNNCFCNSNIKECDLDVSSREDCDYMFWSCKNIEILNLKNCENIRLMREFIWGCGKLEYLEINLTNVEDIKNFINGNNNLKYFKISGLKEYLKGKKEININRDFYDIFFIEKRMVGEKKFLYLI